MRLYSAPILNLLWSSPRRMLTRLGVIENPLELYPITMFLENLLPSDIAMVISLEYVPFLRIKNEIFRQKNLMERINFCEGLPFVTVMTALELIATELVPSL